jgi:SAM-dependent methyltransferase
MDAPPVAAMVVHCVNLLRERLPRLETSAGLFIGCGEGDEVVYTRRAFSSQHVVGVDVEARFSSAARAEGCVLLSDAERLPFPTGTFDFATAFHSLEHVRDPRKALDEVRRVLRPGGWFYLGVPNSSRLVGYLGSFDATTWQKISWNLADWWARLRGRFSNEAGAHAGFRREDLSRLLSERFSSVQLLTEEFLRFKYAGRLPGPLLNLLLAKRIIDYTAPAHYAICRAASAEDEVAR